MSNPHRHLPPEILDSVIDLLHDEPETLKQCFLVSKSWVPRTRRHLFAYIKFRSASDLRSWKKAFPDVADSPKSARNADRSSSAYQAFRGSQVDDPPTFFAWASQYEDLTKQS